MNKVTILQADKHSMTTISFGEAAILSYLARGKKMTPEQWEDLKSHLSEDALRLAEPLLRDERTLNPSHAPSRRIVSGCR